MAQSRYYSATAVPTALAGNITAANIVINVVSAVGFPPSTPFIIALDYGTPSEEVVLVTAVAGTAFTVTRGYDGTSATSHNVGAPVRHTWTAMDGNDSRAHEGSAQGVHGIAPLSFVVGTTDTQTLTNKTLVAPVISGATTISNPNITGVVTGGAEYQSPKITGTVTGNATYQSPTITSDIDADASAVIKRRSALQTGDLTIWEDETAAVLANVTSTGAAHWKQGLFVGPSDQFAVTSTGKISSSTQTTGYGENFSSAAGLTNTTYAAASPALQVTAVVPPSGKVKVEGTVRVDSNTGHFTFSAIQVSGSVSGVIKAPGSSVVHILGTAAVIQSTGYLSMVVTSANIGETITAEWFHLTDSAGGSYTVYARNLTVTPLIG